MSTVAHGEVEWRDAIQKVEAWRNRDDGTAAGLDESGVVDHGIRAAATATTDIGQRGAGVAAFTMRGMRRIGGTMATLGALAGLAAAAGWSWRVGWADYLARQETLEATEEALGWTPGQAAYHFRLGVLAAEKEPARSM